MLTSDALAEILDPDFQVSTARRAFLHKVGRFGHGGNSFHRRTPKLGNQSDEITKVEDAISNLFRPREPEFIPKLLADKRLRNAKKGSPGTPIAIHGLQREVPATRRDLSGRLD
jgi:hypothetical protein